MMVKGREKVPAYRERGNLLLGCSEFYIKLQVYLMESCENLVFDNTIFYI